MEVQIEAGARAPLSAFFELPHDAQGIVIFAHGSGSSRHSSRNQFVARVLQENRMATLLMDLLTPEEEILDEQTAQLRFDIPLLASRVLAAARWCADDDRTQSLPVHYFGASTGAAAALVAAAEDGDGRVRAVVSRGGRPDLAGEALERVRAPTLLIVGGADVPVIAMNEAAARRLTVEHEIIIVPKATHLFREPGALEKVADLAAAWFTCHLQN